MQVGLFRRRDQALDGLLDHALQPRIVIDAAIGGEDALMLALHRRRRARPAAGLMPAAAAAPAASTGGVEAVHAASSSATDSCAGMPKTCDPRTSHSAPSPVTRDSDASRRQSRSAPENRLRSKARPAALLDQAADPDAAAREPFRIKRPQP